MSGGGVQAVAAVDPEEWLRQFESGSGVSPREKDSSTSSVVVAEEGAAITVDEWLKQCEAVDLPSEQQQQQQQQQQDDVSFVWDTSSVKCYALPLPISGDGFRTVSPPVVAAEEFEALRAKEEVLIRANADLRVKAQKVDDHEATQIKLMHEALPLMARVLDEESVEDLKGYVNRRDFQGFCTWCTSWMDAIISLQEQREAAQEQQRVESTHQKQELDELEDELEAAEQARDEAEARLKEMREKAKVLLDTEKEVGRVAYDKVMHEYERLKNHAMSLEQEVDQLAGRVAAAEKARQEVAAVAAAAEARAQSPEEVMQLKKELEQAEAVFNEVKKQNDLLEEERRKLLARVQWKELDTARRWDGGNNDDDDDENGGGGGADGEHRRPDPAGDLLKARFKKTRNKEQAKKMTFARYLESVQRENERNTAEALRNGQQAAILRRSNRELRATNARLEMEMAELRPNVRMPGALINVDTLRQAVDHNELSPDQLRDELVRELARTADELSSTRWRFLAERKEHADARKALEDKYKLLVAAEVRKAVEAEKLATAKEKELEKAAAAREKELRDELQQLKLANERRTQAKNKELEEARGEISSLRKSGNSQPGFSSLPVAVPLESRCGGIAMQILSIVAAKHRDDPGVDPILAEFHDALSALNKARLAGQTGPATADHMSRLYQCMSRICSDDASVLQLYRAVDRLDNNGGGGVSGSAKRARQQEGEADAEEMLLTSQGISLAAVSRDSNASRENIHGGADALLWQDFALTLQPLLHIFVGFADHVTRGTWRQTAPDMRPFFERLRKAAEAIIVSAGGVPPSCSVTRAIRDALAAPVVGGGGAFVNVVEQFARGCIGVNTNFAAETLKQLEEQRAQNAKMHTYNKTLAQKLEAAIGNLLKGIEADPFNPLDARDHHMMMTFQQTLSEVEEDMRNNSGGVIPPCVTNYVNTVHLAWHFVTKTFVAMHPPFSAQQQQEVVQANHKRPRQDAEEQAPPSSPTYQATL